MARQWRIEYPGTLYHILSRGNNRQDIFFDYDRNIFLDILDELSERFNVEIYAYVSMGNHILLKTLNVNLSKGMNRLGTKYTRKFNNKYMETGHLFQGPIRYAD